jgi:antitoxin (DNA-binding transcriptional repressor) of toxin-antitoxin stability system
MDEIELSTLDSAFSSGEKLSGAVGAEELLQWLVTKVQAGQSVTVSLAGRPIGRLIPSRSEEAGPFAAATRG